MMSILHRLDNIEKWLAKNNELERIQDDIAQSRSDTAQLQSELQTFSNDILKHLSNQIGRPREVSESPM